MIGRRGRGKNEGTEGSGTQPDQAPDQGGTGDGVSSGDDAVSPAAPEVADPAGAPETGATETFGYVAGSAADPDTDTPTAAVDPDADATADAAATDGFETILGAPLPDEEVEAKPDTSRVKGWKRVFRGNRMLWITVVIAILSLVAGLAVQRFIISPAEAAADKKPDAPGLVTAPVEFGELSNDVTIRADVAYADAVDVSIDASDVSGAAIVTGRVPAVGDTLDKLSVAMEVAGRPVIVLPGDLPSYRTLRIGVNGPDVVQLKQALQAVGIDGGDPADASFTQQTADAVAALYTAAGYAAPTGDEAANTAYKSAQESVTAAEQGLAQAQAELNKAGEGPSQVQILQANQQVHDAEVALAEARRTKGDVDSAQYLLDIAIAQREEMWAGVNTDAQQGAVDAAQEQLSRAYADLETARQGVQASLPSSEVLFLTDLPRRVDDVKVKRGSKLEGAALSVSGATVRLNGSAAVADAKLLAVGTAGTFALPDGTQINAKISAIDQGKADAQRWSIQLDPEGLTPEQLASVQGTNVRVTIPVGATEGEVLSVPLAALTAGAGGESRIEVVDGDPREGESAKTHLVEVKLGLSAGGFVEVTPTEGKLEEGDLVVIGE
ncbi:hypothetical protein [Microbacterium sp. GXS0129]|uniref:hypothetical protein n=1 Tax=Microbacterium sp. GXS0129 TaxID=3377836 RepID=UPI00383BD4B6